MRGRRIDSQVEEEEEPELFSIGQDTDYRSFEAGPEGGNNSVNNGGRGREIDVNALFNEVVPENAMMFDRDVGESLEDED